VSPPAQSLASPPVSSAASPPERQTRHRIQPSPLAPPIPGAACTTIRRTQAPARQPTRTPRFVRDRLADNPRDCPRIVRQFAVWAFAAAHEAWAPQQSPPPLTQPAVCSNNAAPAVKTKSNAGKFAGSRAGSRIGCHGVRGFGGWRGNWVEATNRKSSYGNGYGQMVQRR
jgi:hypothetical protein